MMLLSASEAFSRPPRSEMCSSITSFSRRTHEPRLSPSVSSRVPFVTADICLNDRPPSTSERPPNGLPSIAPQPPDEPPNDFLIHFPSLLGRQICAPVARMLPGWALWPFYDRAK